MVHGFLLRVYIKESMNGYYRDEGHSSPLLTLSTPFNVKARYFLYNSANREWKECLIEVTWNFCSRLTRRPCMWSSFLSGKLMPSYIPSFPHHSTPPPLMYETRPSFRASNTGRPSLIVSVLSWLMLLTYQLPASPTAALWTLNASF